MGEEFSEFGSNLAELITNFVEGILKIVPKAKWGCTQVCGVHCTQVSTRKRSNRKPNPLVQVEKFVPYKELRKTMLSFDLDELNQTVLYALEIIKACLKDDINNKIFGKTPPYWPLGPGYMNNKKLPEQKVDLTTFEQEILANVHAYYKDYIEYAFDLLRACLKGDLKNEILRRKPPHWPLGPNDNYLD